jgi:hypothetical protein
MANYVSRVATSKIPDYMVIKARVPSGVTTYPGDIITLGVLDTGISNNYQVFVATKPLTATLGTQMALVINDGFETLSDGRRPDGNPDYTNYTFTEGTVITAVLLVPGLMIEISPDGITSGSSAVAGDILEPANNSYRLTRIAAATGRTTGVYTALKVLYAAKNFRIGGNMGAGFATTLVAMVVA